MRRTAADDSPGTELAPLMTLTPAALRFAVERADAGDEGARIGEIDVVAARGDAGARQRIVLLLERAGGVDHHLRRQRPQRRRRVARVASSPACAMRALRVGAERFGMRRAPCRRSVRQ